MTTLTDVKHPILFVAHSLGGIVVKDVCSSAQAGINRYSYYAGSTKIKTMPGEDEFHYFPGNSASGQSVCGMGRDRSEPSSASVTGLEQEDD